ncbi:MAG: C4-type zinc ribbon domain-containing protein [Chloroflexota bacterium]|jgi:uncharacterized protein
MSQARVLYELQQIDTAIRTGKQRLGEVLRLQKEPAELVDARSRTQAIDEELQQLRSKHKGLTLEIDSVTDKVKRSEQQLYSGKVKNPKELNDLQHEVEALGRRRSTLEDDALEILMMIDETQANKFVADEEVSRLTEEWDNSSASLKQQQNKLALRLNGLIEKRKRQVQLAQPDSLRTYEQLLKQKNGLAVAGLLNGQCQGCRVTVSGSTIRAVDEGRLVYCDSCDRILCPI